MDTLSAVDCGDARHRRLCTCYTYPHTGTTHANAGTAYPHTGPANAHTGTAHTDTGAANTHTGTTDTYTGATNAHTGCTSVVGRSDGRGCGWSRLH